MNPELLETEIAETKKRTDKPFGVNLITMHPALTDLIAVCARHGVGHVVLAGGLPPKGSLEAIKAGGAKVICFAPTLALAKKLIRSGVDALVIEGMEAGGFGVIACGAMTPALLEAEIAATQALTTRPFGVNLITMHPDLDALIGICAAARVGHVVLAGGLPPKG